MNNIKSLLENFAPKQSKGYVTREFQDYGYRLAMELGDPTHVSLYIKLAKDTDRILLEKARSFVKDASTAKSKPKLFMWKLKKLKDNS